MLVAKRLVASVSESYRYAETIVTLDCGGAALTAKGKTVLEKGWKRDNIEDNPLPKLTEGEVLDVEDITVKEGKTTPPKHFTEDTLLAAMESAGGEDMPEDAERKGIGTPATRAEILEKLVSTGLPSVKRLHLSPLAVEARLWRCFPKNCSLRFLPQNGSLN